jgi:hypothetical protein
LLSPALLCRAVPRLAPPALFCLAGPHLGVLSPAPPALLRLAISSYTTQSTA